MPPATISSTNRLAPASFTRSSVSAKLKPVALSTPMTKPAAASVMNRSVVVRPVLASEPNRSPKPSRWPAVAAQHANHEHRQRGADRRHLRRILPEEHGEQQHRERDQEMPAVAHDRGHARDGLGQTLELALAGDQIDLGVKAEVVEHRRNGRGEREVDDRASR